MTWWWTRRTRPAISRWLSPDRCLVELAVQIVQQADLDAGLVLLRDSPGLASLSHTGRPRRWPLSLNRRTFTSGRDVKLSTPSSSIREHPSRIRATHRGDGPACTSVGASRPQAGCCCRCIRTRSVESVPSAPRQFWRSIRSGALASPPTCLGAAALVGRAAGRE